jgi:hypothetical protein
MMIILNYFKGKYGVLPFLGDFDNRLNCQWLTEKLYIKIRSKVVRMGVFSICEKLL